MHLVESAYALVSGAVLISSFNNERVRCGINMVFVAVASPQYSSYSFSRVFQFSWMEEVVRYAKAAKTRRNHWTSCKCTLHKAHIDVRFLLSSAALNYIDGSMCGRFIFNSAHKTTDWTCQPFDVNVTIYILSFVELMPQLRGKWNRTTLK